MRGPDGLGHAVTALFRAPLWAVLGEHRYGIYSVDDPHGAGSSCRPAAATAGSTARGWSPRSADGYTPERLVRRIRAAAGVADLDVGIERTGAFSFAAQWPTASAPATSSSPGTPPIGSPRAAAPG